MLGFQGASPFSSPVADKNRPAPQNNSAVLELERPAAPSVAPAALLAAPAGQDQVSFNRSAAQVQPPQPPVTPQAPGLPGALPANMAQIAGQIATAFFGNRKTQNVKDEAELKQREESDAFDAGELGEGQTVSQAEQGEMAGGES